MMAVALLSGQSVATGPTEKKDISTKRTPNRVSLMPGIVGRRAEEILAFLGCSNKINKHKRKGSDAGSFFLTALEARNPSSGLARRLSG